MGLDPGYPCYQSFLIWHLALLSDVAADACLVPSSRQQNNFELASPPLAMSATRTHEENPEWSSSPHAAANTSLFTTKAFVRLVQIQNTTCWLFSSSGAQSASEAYRCTNLCRDRVTPALSATRALLSQHRPCRYLSIPCTMYMTRPLRKSVAKTRPTWLPAEEISSPCCLLLSRDGKEPNKAHPGAADGYPHLCTWSILVRTYRRVCTLPFERAVICCFHMPTSTVRIQTKVYL